TFTLADLAGELGVSVFEGGRIGLGSFRLAELFRPSALAAGDVGAGAVIAFRHAAYQELLAAEFLRTPQGRDAALAALGRPRLTEQVRAFLRARADDGAGVGATDCVLPADVYLVGPSHHLMLRRVERSVRFDRYPVTVARYKRFLAAVARDGSA